MTNRFNKPLPAAYGGPGWRPRAKTITAELGNIWGNCGQNSEYMPLKQVILHRPGPEIISESDPNKAQMLAPLDLARAQAQHDAIAEAYRANGVTVHYADPAGQPTPNQMFMADTMFMTHEGAIIARPASEVRAGEERVTARRLAEIGTPIARSIGGTATFEGADAMYYAPDKVIVGRGLRTNAAGVAQITGTMEQMGVSVVQMDMPFGYGSMHLMGMLRIIDKDLAIGYPVRLAHSAKEILEEAGHQVHFLPDPEEATRGFGFNFVTLGPRKILMAANNPVNQAFFESHDIECVTVEIDELGKAAGAIGCLSGIVERELI
ncbi:MAG: dimethylarginine dimethylaminohydrolase family protein [Anaerolineae bacterium]